jgi:hypothetical protein
MKDSPQRPPQRNGRRNKRDSLLKAAAAAWVVSSDGIIDTHRSWHDHPGSLSDGEALKLTGRGGLKTYEHG